MILPSKRIQLIPPKTSTVVELTPPSMKDLVGLSVSAPEIPKELTTIRLRIGWDIVAEVSDVKTGIDILQHADPLPLYAAPYMKCCIEFVYKDLVTCKDTIEEDETITEYTYSDEMSEYLDNDTNEVRTGFQAYPHTRKTGRKIQIPDTTVAYVTQPEVTLVWKDTMYNFSESNRIIHVDVWQEHHVKVSDKFHEKTKDRLIIVDENTIRFRNILTFHNGMAGFRYTF